LEVAPGRLLPWLPVAFGAGIALYFSADREPVWWATVTAALAAVALAVAARRHPVGFPVALGLAAIATGFAVVTLQTARLAHPTLQISTWSAHVTGYVESREERDRSDRIVIDVGSFDAPRVSEKPERVRVSVRKGTAPDVGTFVALKAHLSPPLPPLRPGGYDFARDMYFQRIGASGYVLGKIITSPPPDSPGLWLRYAMVIDGMRESINQRIHTVLPGDRGSIASALITGKRNAISQPVKQAFYISSLAHVLAISGFHMAVVAGIVFFCVRAGLALVPSLALQRPIKKWAASAALLAAGFYLLMSGSSVSTQRSFIMIAIVLIGVMADRQAITFRTISVAAFVVLSIAPQSVLHPSFQMSFSATLALIAGFQYGLFGHGQTDRGLGQRAALWGLREIAGLILASVVAGLATEPYAAYHFHRVAPYGVIANLLAMPVVSTVVMPMGLIGVLTMPFGLDVVFWHLMGAGIDWMVAVVLWVAALPGAVGHMAAFGPGPLLLSTLGLLLLCLLRSPLRWSGAAVAIAATVWALNVPRPDVLIGADGELAAVRGADGRLMVLHAGRDTYALNDWLAADGDGRDAKDKSLNAGVRCDDIGCTARLADGRVVAFAASAEAFDEDCARTAVEISPHDAPLSCKALLIDRPVWRAQGATALYATKHGFDIRVAHPAGTDRPWARAVVDKRPRVATTKPRVAETPDATPKAEDVEAGD
jgi:competence protein ComEC